MQTSVFLARLIGPVLFVMGLGLLANSGGYRRMAEEFLASRALIYLAGLLTLTAGLAIVLVHNVWTADWRVIVTVFGWVAVFGGAFRMLAPQQVTEFGMRMLARPRLLTGAGALLTALGAALAYLGYAR